MNFYIFIERWGLLLILLYCCGIFSPDLSPKVQLLDLDLNSLSETKSGSDFLKQIFWLALASLYAIIAYINKAKVDYIIIIRSMFVPFLFLITTIFICTLSLIWSDFILVTFKRTIFQIILFWVLVQAFIFCYLQSNLVSTFKYLCYLTILMIFASIINGSGINPYMELAGFTKSKNTMGAVLGVVFIISHLVLSYYNLVRKSKYLLCVVLLLLLFTFSKTSIILVFMYLFLSFFSILKIRFFLTLSFFSIIVVFILIPFVTYLFGTIWHIGLIVEPEFMTGRGVIWDTIYYDLDYFNKLTLGYGYGSFFGTSSTPYFFDNQYSFLRFINSSHNGYIELITQVGILSLFVVSILMFITYFANSKLTISAVSFPIFYNISEPAILRDQHIVWVMCLLLICFASVFNNKGLKPSLRGRFDC
ncbi:hypothetical protein [Shewanella sp. S1-58-MNA-CIBAN-0166]|uniref:hypothetical protein n=1 Tax=Shewanella sp. S1-58-MNA-CIBAN-0166 TaxID=3140467 RepID=UPI00331E0870